MQIADLEARVEELERRLRSSGLFSEAFLTRAFAVWGHFFVAYLLIALAIGLPLALLSIVIGGGK